MGYKVELVLGSECGYFRLCAPQKSEKWKNIFFGCKIYIHPWPSTLKTPTRHIIPLSGSVTGVPGIKFDPLGTYHSLTGDLNHLTLKCTTFECQL